MFLPSTECQNEWHSHKVTDSLSYKMSSCTASKVSVVLDLLLSTDTKAFYAGQVLDNVQGLNTYVPRYWAPLFEATALAHFGLGESVSYHDLHCMTCDQNVSKYLDSEHWDDLCGECYHHSDDCGCCEKCHSSHHDCTCCTTCGETSSWCECCSYCEMAECECSECRDCGEKQYNCTCGEQSSSHLFGNTKTAPWEAREDNPMSFTLPTIDQCENDEIDPVQAVANFYLLDAIKNTVRFADVVGANDSLATRKADVVANDSMLSALTVSAQREYTKLVERLAPSFLAYAVSAVGGELRYHKAVNGHHLPGSRDKAWDKFVKLVQVKGPETLFEANTLFCEFSGNGYGGKKWGDAAKVVGQYLNGTMPDWLFVDRVFTLQHNGGCFLNKVNWAKKNKHRWGLNHILHVLNAHAGKDGNGDDAPTDWDLLCEMASPEIAQMFKMTERATNRVAHRFGGYLVPGKRSGVLRGNRYAVS